MKKKIIAFAALCLAAIVFVGLTIVESDKIWTGIQAKEAEILAGDSSYAEGIELASIVELDYTHRITTNWTYKNGQLISSASGKRVPAFNSGPTRSYATGYLSPFGYETGVSGDLITKEDIPLLSDICWEDIKGTDPGTYTTFEYTLSDYMDYMPVTFDGPHSSVGGPIDCPLEYGYNGRLIGDLIHFPLGKDWKLYVTAGKNKKGDIVSISASINTIHDYEIEYFDGLTSVNKTSLSDDALEDLLDNDFNLWDYYKELGAQYAANKKKAYIMVSDSFAKGVESGVFAMPVTYKVFGDSTYTVVDTDQAEKIIDFEKSETTVYSYITEDNKTLIVITFLDGEFNMYAVDFDSSEVLQKISFPSIDEAYALSDTECFIAENEKGLLMQYENSELYLLAKDESGKFSYQFSVDTKIDNRGCTIPNLGYIVFDYDGEKLAVLTNDNTDEYSKHSICTNTLWVYEKEQLKFACAYHLTADETAPVHTMYPDLNDNDGRNLEIASHWFVSAKEWLDVKLP